jgi:hypothetical protein
VIEGSWWHDEQVDEPASVVTDAALWELIEDYIWLLVIAERSHEEAEPWDEMNRDDDSD